MYYYNASLLSDVKLGRYPARRAPLLLRVVAPSGAALGYRRHFC